MLRPFRSPRLTWFALVAFLVAQPALVCAIQCLDNHHGHSEADSSATGSAACHTHVGPAINNSAAQTLSYMEPAGETASIRLTAVSLELSTARRTVPAHFIPSLDPPPPRLV